jgi:DNA-directed RNA polymerase specialized sigma24 family protein
MLIQNILNGDRVAQETFYKKYEKIIRDFIRSKFPPLKHQDDLDDCVQMILIQVFEHLKTYDAEKSSVKTWVLAITKHFMISESRKPISMFNNCTISLSNNSGHDLVFNGESTVWANGGVVTSTGIDGSAVIGNSSFSCSGMDFENCNSVSYISSQLSPEDFSLLNMKYIQGYDYNEIAQEFNLTSSTISNKINYIKSKIKKNNKEEI